MSHGFAAFCECKIGAHSENKNAKSDHDNGPKLKHNVIVCCNCNIVLNDSHLPQQPSHQLTLLDHKQHLLFLQHWLHHLLLFLALPVLQQLQRLRRLPCSLDSSNSACCFFAGVPLMDNEGKQQSHHHCLFFAFCQAMLVQQDRSIPNQNQLPMCDHRNFVLSACSASLP